MQQARALQQSEAFAGYRQRRAVVEHRLARLVQLGIRQARYFGRVKTKFQLYLAATVANLTMVAAKSRLTGETGSGPPSAGRALVAGIANPAAWLGQIWTLTLLAAALLPKSLFPTRGVSVRVSSTSLCRSENLRKRYLSQNSGKVGPPPMSQGTVT